MTFGQSLMGPAVIDAAIDRRLIPDVVMRAAIRQICAGRLDEQSSGGTDVQSERFDAFVDACRRSPIAIETSAANAQHYEVPPAFFELVLGPHLKYSCGWWPAGVTSLEESERGMLDLSIARADLQDGQDVLELGCGWGSLLLHAAARFPRSRFTALSNSAPQREFITSRAASRGLRNITVVTGDVSHFDTDARFDRIVSVEMLEHVRNHQALFERLSRWLAPDGRGFAHVFSHRRFAYPFDDRNGTDWMARHFFTGGMMPSDDLFLHYQQHLIVEGHWRIDGRHYQRTSEAWLRNLDDRRDAVIAVLSERYGRRLAQVLHARWRVFFLACAEMFGYRNGTEWMVSHYRFRSRP